MKIMVNTKIMKESIKDLNKVKGTNIFIKALENKINIFTNNHFAQLKKDIPADIIEEGTATFSNDIAKMMMKFKEDEITIKDHDIICKNKNLKFTPDGFKEMETGKFKDEYIIETEELLRLLEVDYCIAKEDTRPALKGVCFKNNQTCALDGYRMSLRTSEKIDFGTKFIVPGEAIKILKSILTTKEEQVKISLYEKHVIFSFGGYELTCRLIDENYVNFNIFIPQNVMSNKITIDNVEYLKESIDMMKETYKDKKNKTLLIELLCDNNKLKIQNAGCKIGYTDIIEESQCNTIYNILIFNINYLEALLKNNKYNNLTMHSKNAVSPVYFSENYSVDNFEIILPIRRR